MRVRVIGVAALMAVALALPACSSSSKSSSTTTTTGKSFHVTTDAGQVSLSLNGQLPPSWPSGFPVPSGATVAGSGSLVGGSQGVMVGAYTTTGPPADAFNFYKSSSSLTIDSSKSVGAGSAYVGNLKMSGTYPGDVAIVSLSGTTYIVVVLTGTGTSSSTAATSTT
jgi:hypothetical protein